MPAQNVFKHRKIIPINLSKSAIPWTYSSRHNFAVSDSALIYRHLFLSGKVLNIVVDIHWTVEPTRYEVLA